MRLRFVISNPKARTLTDRATIMALRDATSTEPHHRAMTASRGVVNNDRIRCERARGRWAPGLLRPRTIVSIDPHQVLDLDSSALDMLADAAIGIRGDGAFGVAEVDIGVCEEIEASTLVGLMLGAQDVYQ